MVGIFRMLSHRGGGVGDGRKEGRKAALALQKSPFSHGEALITLDQGCNISKQQTEG